MAELTPELNVKLRRLKSLLAEMGSALVAYSGGVDSTLLLKIAHEVLGERAVAATASSATYPVEEIRFAERVCREIGARQLQIETFEFSDERFRNNPPERCYYCKRELFARLTELARSNGLAVVLDGTNADDAGDFRPGARAGRELGVRSPLREAGLTKADIRALARAAGLSNADKPSFACLATRFPYGTPITPAKLQQVGAAEDYLRGLGVGQMRVRHHGEIARIEILAADMPLLLANREAIAARLKELGFAYVTLDLQGYRTGSMDERLSEATKAASR